MWAPFASAMAFALLPFVLLCVLSLGFTRSTPKGQLANLHTLDVVPDNGYKITTIRFQYI